MGFFPPCTLPYNLKKIFIKQKLLLITIHQKSQNFPLIVSKIRVLEQKITKNYFRRNWQDSPIFFREGNI